MQTTGKVAESLAFFLYFVLRWHGTMFSNWGVMFVVRHFIQRPKDRCACLCVHVCVRRAALVACLWLWDAWSISATSLNSIVLSILCNLFNIDLSRPECSLRPLSSLLAIVQAKSVRATFSTLLFCLLFVCRRSGRSPPFFFCLKDAIYPGFLA